MEELKLANFRQSSEIDGPADVSSELFCDGVLRFGSIAIHPRLWKSVWKVFRSWDECSEAWDGFHTPRSWNSILDFGTCSGWYSEA
jgi:hypothetical protein